MSTTRSRRIWEKRVDLALIQQESKTLAWDVKDQEHKFDPSHVVDPPEEKQKSHPMQLRPRTVNTVEINLIEFSDSGDDKHHQHKAVKIVSLYSCKYMLKYCGTYM